jgi:hypothetical protein
VASLWEDLKTAGSRVLEGAQERSGRRIVRADELERVTEAAADGAVYRKELEYVGWTILNHVGGQHHELTPQSRKTLALKALNAYLADPLGGRIVDHYVAFVLGRGVPKPRAYDPEVQKVIDDTWDDRANKRHLTSADAIQRKARAYCLQQNLYFVVFDDGADGRVRLSSAKFNTVDDVYRHPEERARVLYYVAREQRVTWDPKEHREVVSDPNAEPKVWYYEAHDAFDPDDPVEVLMDAGIWTPPPEMMKPGRLLHLAGNRTDEMAFGVPSFKRLLRWFTAYNEILESYVDRMKAAARLYMQANVTGGRSAVERAGLMAVRRAGGLSPGPEAVEGPDPTQAGPVGRGQLGVVAGNENVKYEPFKIDSGAGDIAAAGPVLRGQVAAGGGFPGWFLGGDPGSLAGSQSVELPVIKFVEVEQEQWARPFTTLADDAIRRAVEVGRLDEYREPTDDEQRAIAAGDYEGELDDRGRVKRDLGYDFSLPDPVKRGMTDLVAAAVQTATAVDPNGDFPLLSRWLFAFLLREAFDVADPSRIVDEVLPLERIREMEAQRQEMQALAQEGARAAAAAASGAAADDAGASTGPDGKQHPPDNPNGARRQSANPEDRTVRQSAEVDRRARARRAVRRATRPQTGGDFDSFEREALEQAALLGAANGNGAGDGAEGR